MTAPEAKKSKLVVYRGWEEQGVYVVSPFVIKLEARLRFSNFAYRVECGSLSESPKGKLPYIQFEDDALSKMSDSTLIIQSLVENGHLENLNESLSPSARMTDLATCALLEEKLYFYNMQERWLDNYYIQRDIALHKIPYPIRVLVGLLVHRKITQTLHGQGTGRFSADEIRTFRHEIYEAINSHLADVKSRKVRKGKQPFWLLGGDRPSEADAVLYGFLVSALLSPAGPESTKLVLTFPVLLDYAGRIHDEYFPDFPKWKE